MNMDKFKHLFFKPDIILNISNRYIINYIYSFLNHQKGAVCVF